MNRKVLITGGAGFLGSHLALHHVSCGDRVMVLDDFTSSSQDSDHVTELKSKGAYVEDVSIEDTGAMKELAEALHVYPADIIYNFACPASPPVYQSMPVKTLMTCTLGTQNVLELALPEHTVVVHASTSEVYGDPDVSPQTESYRGCVNSYGPRACYDEGKRAAEALCYDYLHTYNVDVRLVRIFNTYGPHMDPYDGRVISNFLCQAIRKQPMTVYGHGQQTRSFCYVDDLIRGIVGLAELDRNPLTPINLGNPSEFTISQLVDAVSRLTGWSKTRCMAMPKDDPQQRKPDITLARDVLGWQPSVSLDDGLKRSLEYFERELHRRSKQSSST